jgi:hypothetical protein
MPSKLWLFIALLFTQNKLCHEILHTPMFQTIRPHNLQAPRVLAKHFCIPQGVKFKVILNIKT